MEYTHESIEKIVQSADTPYDATVELLAAICHLEIDRRQRHLEMLDKFDPILNTIGAWFISQMGPK